MKEGDRVHIDADTEEWGRVASDATVIAFTEGQSAPIIEGYVLVEVDSIRANIFVLMEDIDEGNGS